jgi:tripartite-type tricarboxylate transporter receptor subunit TctC
LQLSTGAATLNASGAGAQIYPSRRITMIVPFPPGGTADPIGRILADRMQTTLGQAVVVENIAGANGSIGRLARATGDGYTIGLGGWNTNVANAVIYNLSYDTVDDFQPVALLATFPIMLVGRKSLPADNLKDFISWLKVKQGKATQASVGNGSMGHLLGAHFQAQTGIRFQHVRYRGSAAAMQGVMAEQVDFLFDSPASCQPQIRAGSVKGYAVLAPSRLASSPEIPTVDEAGLPGFYATNWVGFYAPKHTPPEAVSKLNAASTTALADASVQQRIAAIGFVIPPADQQSPEALAAFHKAEIAKWGPIIRAANIKAE